MSGNITSYTGQHLNVGYKKRIYDYMYLTLILSDEIREREELGIKSGGFAIDGEDSKH